MVGYRFALHLINRFQGRIPDVPLGHVSSCVALSRDSRMEKVPRIRTPHTAVRWEINVRGGGDSNSIYVDCSVWTCTTWGRERRRRRRGMEAPLRLLDVLEPAASSLQGMSIEGESGGRGGWARQGADADSQRRMEQLTGGWICSSSPPSCAAGGCSHWSLCLPLMRSWWFIPVSACGLVIMGLETNGRGLVGGKRCSFLTCAAVVLWSEFLFLFFYFLI